MIRKHSVRLLLAFLASVAFLSGRSSAANVVEPFLDPQTFGVVRVDARQADAKALKAWVVERIKARPATAGPADAAYEKQVQDATKALAEPRQFLEKFLADFRAAGGQEIYIIFSATDLLADQPPPVLIPLAAGADVKKLEAAFALPGRPPGEEQNVPSERIGDMLFIGFKPVGQRLRELHDGTVKRAELPDLLAALAPNAAEPAAIQVALAPSAEARRVFEELAPNLPPQLGGGPTSDLTRGFRWASLSLKLPPQPSLRVVIQSPDANAAESLDKLIDRAIEASGKALQDLAENPAGCQDPAMVKAMASLLPKLAPAQEGDRLVLAMDQRGLGELSGILTAGLVQARTSAQRVASLSNIRQQLMAGFMWASEHKGEWPDDLAAAMKKYEIPPQVAANPGKPKSGYTYVKPPKGAKDASERIVLYETEPDAHGRGVGFMDGHGELMTEPNFKARLEAQEKKDNEAAAKK